MKRNIDLTENMMFSRRIIPDGIMLRQLEKTHSWRKAIPWVNMGDWLSSENESIIPQREQVIALGTHTTRQFISECKEADSPYYCDCCGIYLMKKPWKIDGYYTLCSKCGDRLKRENQYRFPWFMKERRDDARRMLNMQN